MVNFPNIPEYLKNKAIWVLHNAKKEPLQVNGLYAKSTDPNTWNTLDNVKKVLEDPKNKKFTGIGFCLDGTISGIDLDHCIDDNGNIDGWALYMIQEISRITKNEFYMEYSPSKRGFHIYFLNNKETKKPIILDIKNEDDKQLNNEGKTNKHIEIYTHSRFFTFTGDVYDNHNKLTQIDIDDINEIIENFIEKFFDKFTPETQKRIKNDEQERTRIENNDIEPSITMQELVDYYSILYSNAFNQFRKVGKEFRGPHPIHGSSTGNNLAINFEKNVWYCFRHGHGGGINSFIGIMEKTISCEEWNSNYFETHTEILEKINKIKQEKFGIKLKQTKKKEKEENENKEKPEIIYSSKFKYQGLYYNEIQTEKGYKFIVFDEEGNIKNTIDELEIFDESLGKKIIFKPAPQITERKYINLIEEFGDPDIIKFPGYPIEFGTPYDLFKDIRKYTHKYVELKSLDEILLTFYVMESSVFDLLKKFTYPMIHILGPHGHGKTRTLTILNYITPYSIYTDNIKAPATKRISQLYAPVLFVDEKGQMDEDLRAVLNARYNRNAVILNADKEIQRGFSGVIAYRIPGPIVLAGREVFNDPAIESKSFQINMDFELKRKDIPRDLKGEIFDNLLKEAKELRDKLMMFRIKYFKKINEKINETPEWLKEFEEITDPRLYELLNSLSDILNIIPEMKEEVMQIYEEQIKQNVLTESKTPEGVVAKMFLDFVRDDIEGKEFDSSEYETEPIKNYKFNGKGYRGVSLKAMYSELGENYKTKLGMILSRLGIETHRVRITYEYNDAKEGKKTITKRLSFARIPEPEKLLQLFKRYDIDYINMIIILKKIGISGFDKEIDIDQVKKRLDELAELDELNIVYRYEDEFGKFLKYFSNFTSLPCNINSSSILSSPSIKSIEILLDYTNKKIKSSENTESNKKLDDYDKGANQGSLDQKGQDDEKIQSNFYEYYVSEYSFDQKYFDNFKARLKRHFEYEMRHYYELEIPENSLSDDKYKIFTSKAQKIDFLKFEDMRERSKEVNKEEKK
ncbi:MAG: hypothetical protein RXP30_01270 [Thermoplasmata archaeon]|nr:hypothetical protein [Euryarchaeota archaeon]